MSESSAASSGLDSETLGELPEYRPISVLALVALAAGLASVLAFANSLLWIVPAIGAALGVAALHRLAIAEEAQIGRRAALVGLTLSLLFGASAATRWAVVRWQLSAETMQLGKQWFEHLREGNPYAAHQLTIDASGRIELDDDLWVRYSEPDRRKQIEEYVQEPLIATLLSLGEYFQVRYYETLGLDAASDTGGASHLYSVSVRQSGRNTSCFVRLNWTRTFDYATKDWQWKLSSASVPSLPPQGWAPTSAAPAG